MATQHQQSLPLCVLYSHETYEDSQEIASYGDLSALEGMLRTMPVPVTGPQAHRKGSRASLARADRNPAALGEAKSYFKNHMRRQEDEDHYGNDSGGGPASCLPAPDAVAAVAAAEPDLSPGSGTADSTAPQQQHAAAPYGPQSHSTLSIDNILSRSSVRPGSHGSGDGPHARVLLEEARRQERVVSLGPSQRDRCAHTTRISSTCSPLSLSVGGAVSAMVSTARYSEFFTRCHCIDGISAEAVSSMWYTAANLAGEYILEPAYLRQQHHLRPQSRCGSCVDGVFVTRMAPLQYCIGLVTTCSERDPSLAPALRDFTGMLNHGLTRFFVELPIGASLRRCTLRLWWTPRQQRVVPHRAMPPVKAILEDHRWQFVRAGGFELAQWPLPAKVAQEAACVAAPGQGSTSSSDAVIFKGYDGLLVFLVRPSNSALRGCVHHPLPHHIGIKRSPPHVPLHNRVVGAAASFASQSTTATTNSSFLFPTRRTGSSSRTYRHNPYAHSCFETTDNMVALVAAEGDNGEQNASSRTPAATTTLVYVSTISSVSHAGSLLFATPNTPALAQDELQVAYTPVETSLAAFAAGSTPRSWESGTPLRGQDTDGVAYWHDRVARDGLPRCGDCGDATPATTARVHIFFNNLTVTNTGEHLMAFETTVEKSYRPFLPILSANLAPFRVVDMSEADGCRLVSPAGSSPFEEHCGTSLSPSVLALDE